MVLPEYTSKDYPRCNFSLLIGNGFTKVLLKLRMNFSPDTMYLPERLLERLHSPSHLTSPLILIAVDLHSTSH